MSLFAARVQQHPAAPRLGKIEQDVTILFLDIEGYAGLSERLPRSTLHGSWNAIAHPDPRPPVLGLGDGAPRPPGGRGHHTRIPGEESGVVEASLNSVGT